MLRKLATSLLAFIALASVANLHAQSLPLLTHHVRDVVLSGQAKSVGRLPATQSMRLVLTLPHRNQAGLDNFLKELYDPSSPNYRHYLGVEEFTTLFGPSQEDYDEVIRFAEANGFTVVGTSRNRVNLDVAGSVASVEKAFHLTIGLYRDPTQARTFFAPDREPTPDLAVRLWHISGLDNYSIPQPSYVRAGQSAIPNATTGSCPETAFCGSDMRAAYYEGTALTGAGQSLGLLEFAGADLADLDTYYANAGQTNDVPVTLLSTDGTSTACVFKDGCDDTEQTIDMTQALGMAPGMSSLVLYIGSGDPVDDSAILNAMATADPPSAQLSSSWSWFPADPNTDDPYFEEFAAQGQNFFQAAGDSGKWKGTSHVWPADSVYVTSVGGTDLVTAGPGGPWQSETAWSAGGGGISPDDFAIPSWQAAIAAGCSECSQAYRNAPDVSANANYSFYVCADQQACSANLYGGTSFSAPMWAGYLALANEQAVTNGYAALGFINPYLYAIGMSSSYTIDFHDIASGSNGYSATPGYDLATGLGSPNDSNLIYALAGTPGGFTLTASPGSISVEQGGTGSSTISSTVGFDASATLSANGQPAGVSVTFSASSISGTETSTMTVSVGATTTAGTYAITVKGTSSSSSATTTVTLTVTAAPNFTLKTVPTSLKIAPGASGKVTVSVTRSGGFDSPIALGATEAGNGVSVTFNPVDIPPTSSKSEMTITVSSTAKAGTVKITVVGKGGGIEHTAVITVTVS